MLQSVASIVAAHPEFESLVRAVRNREMVTLEGPTGVYRAALLARLQHAAQRPLAVVLPREFDREALLLDLRAFRAAQDRSGRVVAFPPLGVDPYGTLTPHPDHIRERIQTLDRCCRGRVDIVLAPLLSWLERLQPPARFQSSTLKINSGDRLPQEDLVAALAAAGYRRHAMVESLGEFAVRGGIVDVFPPTHEQPLRFEYFGDEIESIRAFNSRDQRSMRAVEFAELPPAREHFDLALSIAAEISAPLAAREGPSAGKPLGVAALPGGERQQTTAASPMTIATSPVAGVPGGDGERAPDPEVPGGAAAQTPEPALLADYLRDPLWVEIEPESFDAEAAEWFAHLDEHYHRALADGRAAQVPEDLYCPLDEGLRRRPDAASAGGRALLRELATDGGDDALRLLAPPAPAFQGRLADLAESVGKAVAAGERVCLAMSQPGSAERLAEVLEEYGVPAALALGDDHQPGDLTPGTCWVICADLTAGFRLPEGALWLGTDAEVFGRTRVRGRRRRFHGDAFKAEFRNLALGDRIVHVEHGIGRFIAMRTLDVGGEPREFMELHYRGDDRLYLPMDQLHLVQRYQGTEGAAPKLDKLGGTSWGKVKGRVKKELRDMASELLELYAARETIKGHVYGEDTTWQREMEDAFEYEETPDQLTAIAEIKADMESDKPMDRLLCGDVGYGKTEVAMRAAFKAVMDGKQVAVLAPTTVLAHQHSITIAERIAGFPVQVELLSRFRSDKEQKAVLAKLEAGTTDILVGTHRILSADVRFHDLGLLIVDEEQRFGVQDKERLKKLRRNVDVLSMTATPIPRTLQMSLIGVRDLSVIESPPRGRFAVATHVMAYDPEVIAAAIRAELSRAGQVYFVHNRVETIYSITHALRALVPEARFIVGHGQLQDGELERVMLAFMSHEADVLVCTTIIENGLDIPAANTMIVNRADRFGLAQLYQLRGRIGRSDRRASAYLMIPPPDTLSEVARQRLRGIQEFAALGSGFRLAALDLEIRGAGSLLGERQHGHMAAVGFEMYARLLEEAVHELEGQPTPAETRAQLNLGVGFEIPVAYIEDPLQRVMVAKRLASVRDAAQLDALRDEVHDRYGAPPRAAEELFDYALLRLEAEALGILSVDRAGTRFELRIGKGAPIDLAGLMARVEQEPGWSIRPPDRLVVLPSPGAAGKPASEGRRSSPVPALRLVLDALPSSPAEPA